MAVFLIFEETERKVETKTILLSALANLLCMFCEWTFICIIIPFGRLSGFCELNYVCWRKYRTNLDNSAGWWNGIKIWQFVRRFWNLIKFNYSSGCLSCGGLAFNFLSTFPGPGISKQTTLVTTRCLRPPYLYKHMLHKCIHMYPPYMAKQGTSKMSKDLQTFK